MLSVVVPTRDTRALVLRCLETVYAAGEELAPGELEVVVVDDAGGDGTVEALAAAAPRARVIARAQPGGFAAAANQGLAAARGELLLLLNSDTEIPPGSFTALRAAFAADPSLGVAGAQLLYPDGSAQWSGGAEPTLLWLAAHASGAPGLLRHWRRRAGRPGRPWRSGPVDWVSGAAMALRRALHDQVGALDEGFRFYAQDLDYCLRARAAGWGVELVAGFRVRHHHGASIGRAPGAAEGVAPALLWADLLRWAEKRHGARWRRRAALALRGGSLLRLGGRGLALPFLPAARRAAWRRDSAAYAAARRGLRALR